MPVDMVTRKVRERTEKNAHGEEETIDIIAFFFQTAQRLKKADDGKGV